jgi:hypothetical protein
MDFGSAESFKVQNRQGRKDRLHLPVITTWPAPSPFGKRSEGLASPPVEDQPGCRYIAADSQLTLRSRLCQYGSRRLRFRILTSSAAEVTFPVANEMKIVATSQASNRGSPSSIDAGLSVTRSMKECLAALPCRTTRKASTSNLLRSYSTLRTPRQRPSAARSCLP